MKKIMQELEGMSVEELLKCSLSTSGDIQSLTQHVADALEQTKDYKPSNGTFKHLFLVILIGRKLYYAHVDEHTGAKDLKKFSKLRDKNSKGKQPTKKKGKQKHEKKVLKDENDGKVGTSDNPKGGNNQKEKDNQKKLKKTKQNRLEKT